MQFSPASRHFSPLRAKYSLSTLLSYIINLCSFLHLLVFVCLSCPRNWPLTHRVRINHLIKLSLRLLALASRSANYTLALCHFTQFANFSDISVELWLYWSLIWITNRSNLFLHFYTTSIVCKQHFGVMNRWLQLIVYRCVMSLTPRKVLWGIQRHVLTQI
jgi:hypothetical protein